MFPLRHIASFMIAQRQIVSHDALLHQAPQRSMIHFLLSIVSIHRERASVRPHQPSRTERQRSERLANMCQQCLGLLHAQRRELSRNQREVRAFSVLDDHSLSCGGERFDRVHLAFEHAFIGFLCVSSLSSTPTSHQRHRLPCMDRSLRHRVSAEIPHRLNRVGPASDRHFMRRDHFFDDSADFSQTRVHSSLANPRVRRLLRRQKQLVELGVERDGERAVDDVACVESIEFRYRSPAYRSRISRHRRSSAPCRLPGSACSGRHSC